jgi:hypothetical protein
MARRLGALVTGSLVAAFVGLMVLVGCDKSLKGGDPISPRADVRITAIILANQSSILTPFVGSISGTQSTTPVTSVAFPDITLQLAVFNGVSVNFTRFMIEYFQEDGVTPLGVRPLTGFVDQFLLGGFPSAADLTSIAPTANSTNILVGGIVAGTQIRIPGVSLALRNLFAGGDGRLGTADDLPNLVVGLVTLFGEDINKNDFRVQSRFTISATIPVVATGT